MPTQFNCNRSLLRRKLGNTHIRPCLIRGFTAMIVGLIGNAANALGTQDGLTLNRNMTLTYHEQPESVTSWSELLDASQIIGRLRSNTFFWRWHEADGTQQNHQIGGLGGSIILRSGRISGFGIDVGVYATSNPYLHVDQHDYGALKAGRDVISRGTGESAYGVIGQANLHYQGSALSLTLGRQLYESTFTASNDTKMIPNTFDGIGMHYKVSGSTALRAAYFYQTKARGHANGHDLITVGNTQGDLWLNQDDPAAHYGLSYQRLEAAGLDVDNPLIMAGVEQRLGDVTGHLDFLQAPNLFHQAVLELKGNLAISTRWQWKPALKFMVQQDDQAGSIGGASGRQDVSNAQPKGYTDPDNLNSHLIAARMDFEHLSSGLSYRIGYSQIADQADLVAPWRGFPTAGYTRPMGQYNWTANETSWMLQLYGPLDRLMPWRGTRLSIRLSRFDRDERKGFIDRDVINVDIDQQLNEHLWARLRLLRANDDGPTGYNEYRIEVNQFF